ncbi:MAG TPA: hypothetical protein ENI23_06845 [bacterium]|nr:hypothetical protein [bacterium]
MVKSIYQEEINAISIEDLICEVGRNRRDLENRWTKGRTYGGGVRITSKLEHRQVLCQDRLLDELLGPGWEQEPDFIEFVFRWIKRKRKDYKDLQDEIS